MFRLRYTSRHIPEGSTEVKHPENLGVVYTQDMPTPMVGKYYAKAYQGKALKPAFYEAYRTVEARDKRIAEWFQNLTARAAMIRDARVKRYQPHSLKPGDLLHYSWGYDQTNCDFFQVVKTTPNGVYMREIGAVAVPGSQGFMSERLKPSPNAFHGPEIFKRVTGDNYVSMDHGCATRVTPDSAFYSSWYA